MDKQESNLRKGFFDLNLYLCIMRFMTENKEFSGKEIDEIINQITDPGREGNLMEIIGRINYLSHVRENPTKRIGDAVEYLYLGIDSLSGYVTKGIGDEDIACIKTTVVELFKRNIVEAQSSRWFDPMINKILRKRECGEISQGYGICIVLSPNTSDSLPYIIEAVPTRVIKTP